jgi:uncharacterized protein YxeA
MKRILVVILVLILAIGLSGCKEDMTSGDSQVVKKTSADKKKSADFQDMVAKKANLQFKVTYTMDIDTQGQKMTYKTAQYVGGQNKMRVDTEMMDIKTRGYFLPDGIYSCNDRDGWQCMKMAKGEDIGQQDYTADFDEVAENPEDYDISYAGTMSIAGTKAHCYGITYGGQTMKECFSTEGVPLYMEMDGVGMEYVMKATSYSTRVSDSDFDLPAKAQDMENIMEDYMEQLEGQMPAGMEDYQ